ncbi:MAG: hypothetical protein WCT52_04740 [Candidatus Micrarchaeia archaeon]
MATELMGRMKEKVVGMPTGAQRIGEINAFHNFSSKLYSYIVDEIGKNHDKRTEILVLNKLSERALLPECRHSLKMRAHGAFVELAQVATNRMKTENNNGTAGLCSEFFDKIFAPAMEEVQPKKDARTVGQPIVFVDAGCHAPQK